MGDPEENEGKGFTVIDRRGSGDEEPSAPEPEPAAAEPPPPEPRGELPKIDFATFVLSLGTSALYHLGIAPDPASGQTTPDPDLPLARQTIDTLEMLEEKTRGNLDEEESRLLGSVLYELRMRYVERSK